MRRTLVLTALLLVCACGDPAGKPAAQPGPGDPAAAAPGPSAAKDATPAPFETAFDDQALAALVADCARSGRLDEISSLALPPRCDRVRAAVRLLHDELVGSHQPPLTFDRLFAALDALSRAKGGASAGALGDLVKEWRAWTEQDRANEKEQALHYAAALRALSQAKLDGAALAASLAGLGSPPAKSPAAAHLSVVRAGAVIAATPGDVATQEIVDALDHAQRKFADLGWPGGFGVLAEEIAKRLYDANPASARAEHVIGLAQAAYARSGDEVAASLAFVPMAEAARRRGDLKQAEYLADAGRLRLLKTGSKGPETFRVMRLHGELAQMLGRQAEAARDLGRAWEEGRTARVSSPMLAATALPYTTSLVLLGRFDEAYAVSREAARMLDAASAAGAKVSERLRAETDAMSAQAAMEAGRAAEAVQLYRSAADRFDAAAARDPDAVASAHTARILAARAMARSGDAEGAAKAVAGVLAGVGVLPSHRASAASVLREAGRLQEADRELSRAESETGEAAAELFTEERARLAAAAKDVAGARNLFRRAVALATNGSSEPVGWDAARPLLDWARMEEGARNLSDAADLAWQAVLQLRDSGLVMELDRARQLFVGVQRRRGWFVDAAAQASARVDSMPAQATARGEEALLDLLLIRIELVFEKQKDADAEARETADRFPEGWRRETARWAVAAALAGGGAPASSPVLPPGAGPRWNLLRDVASAATGDEAGAASMCSRCGETEPELRRWAARRLGEASLPLSHDIRRRYDPGPAEQLVAAAAPDEIVLSVEPFGDHLEVCAIANGHAQLRRVEGDGGLGDFRTATQFEPTQEKVAAAAAKVGESVFASVRGAPESVKRVVLSIPEVYGFLPFDLVPFEGAQILDRFEVVIVPSVTQLARARFLPEPPMLSELPGFTSRLESRHAIVRREPVDPASRARLFQLLGEAQNAGAGASAALRKAKLALRAQWKPDPSKPFLGVPPWASFLLRGAP